jgi:hypothetical protein
MDGGQDFGAPIIVTRDRVKRAAIVVSIVVFGPGVTASAHEWAGRHRSMRESENPADFRISMK